MDIKLFPNRLKINKQIFVLVKQVRGRGPEQREPNKAVLFPLIIIILITYIIIYYC